MQMRSLNAIDSDVGVFLFVLGAAFCLLCLSLKVLLLRIMGTFLRSLAFLLFVVVSRFLAPGPRGAAARQRGCPLAEARLRGSTPSLGAAHSSLAREARRRGRPFLISTLLAGYSKLRASHGIVNL